MPAAMNDTFQIRIQGQLVDCITATAFSREVVKNSYSMFYCNYEKIVELIELKLACDSADNSALWVTSGSGHCQNADESYTAFAQYDILYTNTLNNGTSFTTIKLGNLITGTEEISGKSTIYSSISDIYALTDVPKGTIVTLYDGNSYTLYTKITTVTSETTSSDWQAVGSSNDAISSYLDLADKPDIYYGVRALNEETADAIVRIVGDAIICYGDITIIRDTSNNTDAGVTYNTSAYIRNATSWIELTGKTDIDHIMINKNFNLSGAWTNLGNIQKSASIYQVKGKSLYEMLDEIFNAVCTPTVHSAPVVSITSLISGNVEIGTSVTQNYTISFTDGTYDCAGDREQMQAFIDTYAIEYSGSGASRNGEPQSLIKDDRSDSTLAMTGAPGTFIIPPNYSKSYSLYARVVTEHYAINNHNEQSDFKYAPATTNKILSDSSTYAYTHISQSQVLRSYRQGAFYGGTGITLTDGNMSSVIRALGKLNDSYPTSVTTKNFTIYSGTKSIIVAVISGSSAPTLYNNTVNSPITLTNIGTYQICAADNSTLNASAYDIYVYTPDVVYRTTNSMTVTINP